MFLPRVYFQSNTQKRPQIKSSVSKSNEMPRPDWDFLELYIFNLWRKSIFFPKNTLKDTIFLKKIYFFVRPGGGGVKGSFSFSALFDYVFSLKNCVFFLKNLLFSKKSLNFSLSCGRGLKQGWRKFHVGLDEMRLIMLLHVSPCGKFKGRLIGRPQTSHWIWQRFQPPVLEDIFIRTWNVFKN